MELDWFWRRIGRLCLGVLSLCKNGAKLVGVSYLFAFMYVVIVGTFTERSDFNKMIGTSMFDEFTIALCIVFVLYIIHRILKLP
jgi:hypothetical protein